MLDAALAPSERESDAVMSAHSDKDLLKVRENSGITVPLCMCWLTSSPVYFIALVVLPAFRLIVVAVYAMNIKRRVESLFSTCSQ